MTHDPMRHAPSAPLWSQDTLWKAVPIPGRDRQKALPHARGRAWLWWTQGIAQWKLQARPLHGRSDCLSQVVEAANTPSEGVD
jgi:hypothetical protein